MPPKNREPKKRLRPSEMMTVGARTPSPTPDVLPSQPKRRKQKSTQDPPDSSQVTQEATQLSSQRNSAGRRWKNDSINDGPTSYALLIEWLSDADNLDLLKHGKGGNKSKHGAQVCSEWIQAQGGPQVRSVKAILGEYDRLKKTWETAEAWRNGTGNGQGSQVARDAEPTPAGRAKAAQTIDEKIYELCDDYDDLHPIFTNRIGGTIALRGHSNVPLAHDAVFNGMKQHRLSKGKQQAQVPSPSPPSLPLPSPAQVAGPSRQTERSPTFSPSHWLEPVEAEVLEGIGRGDVLDRSSPIGQASLADSRSNPRRNPQPRRSPTPLESSFDGSTGSYMEAEANWRAKKEDEWRKQEAYRDKKLHAVEKQVDIERKREIRELAKELRDRNPDLSVQRSLLDAAELIDTL